MILYCSSAVLKLLVSSLTLALLLRVFLVLPFPCLYSYWHVLSSGGQFNERYAFRVYILLYLCVTYYLDYKMD